MLAELMQQAEAGNVDALLPLVDELEDAGMTNDEEAEELVALAHNALGSDEMTIVMVSIANYQLILKRINNRKG